MGMPGQDQFVFVQNGEPGGLYCADESDGESLRVCEQIGESLLSYKVNGTEVAAGSGREFDVEPRPEGVDLPPPQGVKFSDGSAADGQRRREDATGCSGTPPIRSTRGAQATSRTARPRSAAS